MHLNEKHPRFDRANEVLCLLPPGRVFVPIRLIAHDVGIDARGGHTVKGLLKVLSQRGVGVEITEDRAGQNRAVCIAPLFRDRARDLAESYFDELYPVESGDMDKLRVRH